MLHVLLKRLRFKMKSNWISALVLLLTVAVSGCTTNPYTGESQTAKSVKYGSLTALALGGVGALIGGEKGAIIGATIGASVGGGYGYYTDVQEKKLRQQMAEANANIEVSRNQQNQLMITMPSDITFNSGSAEINASNYQALMAVAGAVKERNGTMLIVGHTDNTGSLELNQSLSLARATSVANYMFAQGIPMNNIRTDGMAFHQPIASNATVAGREQNRRVEIILQ